MLGGAKPAATGCFLSKKTDPSPAPFDFAQGRQAESRRPGRQAQSNRQDGTAGGWVSRLARLATIFRP